VETAQRHLKAKASLPSPRSPLKWRMTGRESGNSLRPMTFQFKTVHATLLKALQLSKKLARWAMKLVYEEKKID
jgi:hypothetical protein